MAALWGGLLRRAGCRVRGPCGPGQDGSRRGGPLAGPAGCVLDDVQYSGPVADVDGLYGAVDLLDRRQHRLRGDVGADPAPVSRFLLCRHLCREVCFLSVELAQRTTHLDGSEPA